MAEPEILVGIEIDARKRQIEVTTMRRGKGRHTHFASLRQATPEMRGEALQLIRAALVNSGYESLTELEEGLTSELVLPAEEDDK